MDDSTYPKQITKIVHVLEEIYKGDFSEILYYCTKYRKIEICSCLIDYSQEFRDYLKLLSVSSCQKLLKIAIINDNYSVFNFFRTVIPTPIYFEEDGLSLAQLLALYGAKKIFHLLDLKGLIDKQELNNKGEDFYTYYHTGIIEIYGDVLELSAEPNDSIDKNEEYYTNDTI